MKITLELLKNKNACQEGINMFLEYCPSGETAEFEWNEAAQGLLIASCFRVWFGWLVENSILSMYSFNEANLYKANLEGVNLYKANLKGSNLKGANLYKANLYKSNLKGANLEGANLEGVNLEWANLKGANLKGANLYKANFPEKFKYLLNNY